MSATYWLLWALFTVLNLCLLALSRHNLLCTIRMIREFKREVS